MLGMQLKVTNIHGQIGININDASLSIRQPPADMEITTKPAELNMETNQVKIKIDQSQCFSEAGLKDVFELTEEFAQRGREVALEAVGNIAGEGDRMAMIENRADPFVEIATNKALPPPAEFNIALMPVSRPKIEFEGGVYFNPQMGQVDIRVQINAPEISSTQPSLDIYLLQKPVFSFEFVGNTVDIRG
jgi:hypothetical protein